MHVVHIQFTVSPGDKFKSTNKIDGGVENTGTVRDSVYYIFI